MKKTILILMTGVTVFAACKKSDKEKTTQEKVLGKWGVTSVVSNAYYGGILTSNTYTGVSTDYVDFRSDGKVYSNTGGRLDTASYSVLSDYSIKIDTVTNEIKTLTDNSFVLYTKQVYGPNYFENTESLKK